MHLCTDCHTLTLHDDVNFVFPDGTCLCLLCDARRSVPLAMPVTLRDQIATLLDAIEAA